MCDFQQAARQPLEQFFRALTPAERDFMAIANSHFP